MVAGLGGRGDQNVGEVGGRSRLSGGYSEPPISSSTSS